LKGQLGDCLTCVAFGESLDTVMHGSRMSYRPWSWREIAGMPEVFADYQSNSFALAIYVADVLFDGCMRVSSSTREHLFRAALLTPPRRETPCRPLFSNLSLFYTQRLTMRVQSLVRAQSLASSCLRSSTRSASGISSRCALSTAAASRTPYTNGTKTDTWISNQQTRTQRRCQSAAAQVYAQSCAAWGIEG
jgi:hypothetical protein